MKCEWDVGAVEAAKELAPRLGARQPGGDFGYLVCGPLLFLTRMARNVGGHGDDASDGAGSDDAARPSVKKLSR